MAGYARPKGPMPDMTKLSDEARDTVMGARTKGEGECTTGTTIDGDPRFRGEVLGLPSRFVPRCEAFGCDRREKVRCARCKRIRYCCRAQQKAHWRVHKAECGGAATRPCGACGAATAPAAVRRAACCGAEWCAACADAGLDGACPFCGDAAPSLDGACAGVLSPRRRRHIRLRRARAGAAIARLRRHDRETALEVAQRRCGAWLFPLMRLGEMVASWRLQSSPPDADAVQRYVGAYVERNWDPPPALQSLAIEVAAWVDGFAPRAPLELFRLVPDASVPALAGGHAALSAAADAALAAKFKASLDAHLGEFVDGFVGPDTATYNRERSQRIEAGRLAVMVFLDVCGPGLPESMRAALEMNNHAAAY